MPGIVLGGTVGAHFAEELPSRRLRRAIAVLVLVIGVWETSSAMRKMAGAKDEQQKPFYFLATASP